MTRAAAIDAFLCAAGWAEAQRAPLAGDASARRYQRLTAPDGAQAVLMDAPPDRGEDVGPFLAVGSFLRKHGFSAPAVLSEDRQAGFLLLEDLGSDLYSSYVSRYPAEEHELYAAAVDVLIDLHRVNPPPGPRYQSPEMAPLAGLAAQWYARDMEPDALAGAMAEALRPFDGTGVLVLRDYHADNLLWLPARKGNARVGLLDFQDGAEGHATYDLVSLLGDVRRDVPQRLRSLMMARYAAATGWEPEELAVAAAVMSAQRNLRILGVFARLCVRDGKPGYLDWLPRVWAGLQADLAHPSLTRLAGIAAALPPPDTAHLAWLRSRCPGQ